MVSRAEIERQNQYLLRQQHDFRRAADIVTDALAAAEGRARPIIKSRSS
ncbi:hypothetical protein ACQR1Y_14995 [Bradyrhizobium sp. HKCCYLRH3099]